MSRRGVASAVFVLALLLLGGRVFAGWAAEYQWYDALDASTLFWLKARNLLWLRGSTLLVGGLFVFVNLLVVRQSVQSLVLPRRVGNLEIGEEVPGHLLVLSAVAIAATLALALSLLVSDWTSLELARNGDPFRESDPYFQADLRFWTSWLPLEHSVHRWAVITAASTLLLVTVFYALTPSLRLEAGRVRVTGHVRRHFFALFGVLLGLLAWSFRLDAYDLLLSDVMGAVGFDAVDHKVRIPASLVLAMGTLVGASLLVWAGWVRQYRVALAAFLGLMLLWVGARQAAPAFATQYISPSDATARNRPYASTRSIFTRRAFGTDRIASEDSTGAADADAAARLSSSWDTEAVSRSVREQRLPGRPRGAPGWELRDGRLHAFVVTQPVGPEAADIMAPWHVVHLDATIAGETGALHRSLSLEEGVQRTPPVMVADSLTGYAVIFDSIGAIAAPTLKTARDRLVHAWAMQNPRVLSARQEAPPAKVVQHRGVRERVRRLYPFFMQSNRVVPVIAGDSLFWSVHLYASSTSYPLSESISAGGPRVRYWRHAAVALVNAHTGRTLAIPDPAPDPIAASWVRRLPALFTRSAQVPATLLSRIPPPGDGTLLQARVLARFGRRGEVGPPSAVPFEMGADTTFGFPTFAPFVDQASGRLGVSVPVVDAADRLRGTIVVRGGADLRESWRPVDASAAPRWEDVLASLRTRLDSVEAGSGASPVARGPVRLIPFGPRLLATQSSYLWRAEAAPILVGVAIDDLTDHRAAGRTLGLALGVAEPVERTGPLTAEAFRTRVTQLYRQMQDALARGDLGGFGVAYNALGQLVRSRSGPP